MKPLVLCLCGPTAGGKTAVSLALANLLPVEIVAMDAMQVYRRMNIGTAKPTRDERARVPHHMIDIVEPDESYSVALYRRDATACVDAILRRGKVPLLVGGTGMFLRALSLPLDYGHHGADAAVRAKYEAYARQRGNAALHALLQERDAATASRLHENDVRRIVRALEVLEVTGQPLSRQVMPSLADGPYRILPFCPDWPREALYRRIEARVDAMDAAGLEAEARGLLSSGVPTTAQAMQSIGYKEWLPYFAGRLPRSEVLAAIKQATRRYAKRQLTWLRADPRVQYFPGQDAPDRIARHLKEHYDKEPR